jgi:arylsulfatase A-like enzyme
LVAKATGRFHWGQELLFSSWVGLVTGAFFWGLELLVFVIAKLQRHEIWFYMPFKMAIIYILIGILLAFFTWACVFVLFKQKSFSRERFRRIWILAFLIFFLLVYVLSFFLSKTGPVRTGGSRGLLMLGLVLVLSFLSVYFISRSPKRIRNLLWIKGGFVVLCGLASFALVFFMDLNTLTFPEADQEFSKSSDRRPNIIMVTVDALRPDHISCYGSEKVYTPNIDRIAKEGVQFKNCFSVAPWTRPSMASIMTSLYPSQHGALMNVIMDEASFHTIQILEEGYFSNRNVTLTEVLKDFGYYNVGFYPNISASSVRGFSQGYDFFFDCFKFRRLVFEELISVLSGGRLNKFIYPSYKYARDEVLERYIETWLSENRQTQFFLSALYFDVHEYHLKEKRKKEDFYKPSESFYVEEVIRIDQRIGELYDFLEKNGFLDETILVLLSDHGEEFGDHGGQDRGNEFPYDRGAFHGHTLYDELLRIPLIIRYPEKIEGGTVISRQVRSLDIMPTILSLAGVSSDLKMEGVSLFQDGLRVEDNLPVYAESVLEGTEKKALRTSEWKLIFHPAYGKYELYDLSRDPEESDDVSSENKEVLEGLQKQLFTWMQRMDTEKIVKKDKKKLTDKEIEALKALGYLK